jgi:hypothetical protein
MQPIRPFHLRGDAFAMPYPGREFMIQTLAELKPAILPEAIPPDHTGGTSHA